MFEDSFPLEDLTNVCWKTGEPPTSFLSGGSSESRGVMLGVIARSVFTRRRIELANNLKATQVLELIALVISKTYAEQGDSFQLADDEALLHISDLLHEHDPHMIQRYSRELIPERQLLKQLQEIQVNID
jgi:hypothetical protein